MYLQTPPFTDRPSPDTVIVKALEIPPLSACIICIHSLGIKIAAGLAFSPVATPCGYMMYSTQAYVNGYAQVTGYTPNAAWPRLRNVWSR